MTGHIANHINNSCTQLLWLIVVSFQGILLDENKYRISYVPAVSAGHGMFMIYLTFASLFIIFLFCCYGVNYSNQGHYCVLCNGWDDYVDSLTVIFRLHVIIN